MSAKRSEIMKWLETIHIQGNTIHPGKVGKHLESLIASFPKDGRHAGLIDVSVYRHGALAEDCLVVLSWERTHLPQAGSTLGLRIRETMSAFGLIDYSFWRFTKGENHD
jgi:hypothetical protein